MKDYKKKYEETLEKAKTLHKLACETSHKNTRMAIEELFPELKKNEDEKIRKTLKSFFDSEISDYGNVEWRNGIRYGEIVAWLEKQGERNELKKIEQKSAWSEEDEETLNNILNDLSQNVIPDDEDTQWLKSLKERYTWRPTEEQMKALKNAAFDAGYEQHFKEEDVLESLIEDLKKL